MGKKKHNKRHQEFAPIGIPLIDSHCHVAPHVYGADTLSVIKRAFDSGIERMVNIGAGHGMDGNREVIQLARQEPRLHPTIGIHPHDAHLLAEDSSLEAELFDLAKTPDVVGYGEIGLDYHYDLSPRNEQQAALRVQLEIARSTENPVIIHVREAEEDLFNILEEMNAWQSRVLIHCFPGDISLAEECLARGAYLGITGIVTFKNSDRLREVVARVPLERLLIETDSPYLTPHPFRGTRNEPAHVHLVAREIAKLRQMNDKDVARATASNTRRFFRLPIENEV
jgi:TatD DNase family protein